MCREPKSYSTIALRNRDGEEDPNGKLYLYGHNAKTYPANACFAFVTFPVLVQAVLYTANALEGLPTCSEDNTFRNAVGYERTITAENSNALQ